jgi:hypothetical protein
MLPNVLNMMHMPLVTCRMPRLRCTVNPKSVSCPILPTWQMHAIMLLPTVPTAITTTTSCKHRHLHALKLKTRPHPGRLSQTPHTVWHDETLHKQLQLEVLHTAFDHISSRKCLLDRVHNLLITHIHQISQPPCCAALHCAVLVQCILSNR